MALVFADGFDHYATAQLGQKWTNINRNPTVQGPGRLGYGNYVSVGSLNGSFPGSLTKALPATLGTVIVGFAYYYNTAALQNTALFVFQDAGGANMGTVGVTASGQMSYNSFTSAPSLVPSQTWCYIEAQVTFATTAVGSFTLRLNGQTILSQSAVITSGSGATCALVGPYNSDPTGSDNMYYDDLYVLNTTAPNNAFLGDVKIVPLYPAGNGRISGFSRFGGTSSGNYTAVNEVPPDSDTSYVYSAVAGTVDAYTLTSLSNVATIKAVQLNGYVRKDDTPSRIVSLGVGNGSIENFDAGTSVNTTYTYITRDMDTNPLTSAAWAVGDFTTLQSAVKLIS